jgi:hypothetical protein
MYKWCCTYALVAVMSIVFSVDVASAGLEGPSDYGGHGYSHCEAATHLSYYDVRNDGHTVYQVDYPNGDNGYYVDTDPTAGFAPDGNYAATNSPSQDCNGTHVLNVTAFGAVTVIGGQPSEDKHIGFPKCPRVTYDDRNPYCTSDRTGVQAAFYVGTPDHSYEVGKSVGFRVP